LGRSQIIYRAKFVEACSKGRLKNLKSMMDNSLIDLEQGEDSLGMRGLKLAIYAGHLDIVKYLVEECHVDVHEKSGKAIYFAGESGNLKIAKYLVEECQVNIHADEEVALCSAAHEEHFDVVKYLIRQGADYNFFKDETYWEEEYKFCLSAVQEIAMEQKEETRLIKSQRIKKAEQRFKDNIILLKQEGGAKKPVRRRSVFKK